jgi:hypothetical protein
MARINHQVFSYLLYPENMFSSQKEESLLIHSERDCAGKSELLIAKSAFCTLTYVIAFVYTSAEKTRNCVTLSTKA